MKKRILSTFFLLALLFVAGFYVMNANAKGEETNPEPTQTEQPTQTATADTCEINTGIPNGTVNLRTCEGTACGVLAILTEGERLDILTAGNWAQVTNADGVTGWLNSKYCKGK
jgi:uncharacterized protein YgiM (DUF1202 family)